MWLILQGVGTSLAAPTKAFAPLLHGAPSLRPRGRPPGARAQVVRDNRALGIHHFAFVRASLLGLDLPPGFEVPDPSRPPLDEEDALDFDGAGDDSPEFVQDYVGEEEKG